jgi:uncharacterized protein with HEPN domain
MPGRDWKFRISDILEATENILEITRGLDYEGFCQEKQAMQAVLYNFAVIGEAARKMPEQETARYPAIPWREMGDMRNIVIHEYFGINTEILWETILNELPPLVEKLKEILVAN